MKSSYIILFILCCSIEVTPTNKRQLNYGVIFEAKNDIVTSVDSLEHIFLFELPDVNKVWPDFGNCSVYSFRCDHLGSDLDPSAIALNKVFEISIESKNHLHQLIDEIKSMIEDDQNPEFLSSRIKRSLLPFVADIGLQLFGFGRQKDFKKLQRYSEFLGGEIHDLGKKLENYIHISNDRIDNIVGMIKDNHEELLSFEHKQFIYMKYFKEHWTRYFVLMSNYVRLSTIVENQISKIQTGVHDLFNGKLTLIPKIIMQAVINDLKKDLSSEHYLVYEDPNTYIQNADFVFTRINNQIAILVKFPVGYDSALRLYSIQIVPVPINSTSLKSTILAETEPYLAISHDNQNYATPTETQLQTCTGKHLWTCNSLMKRFSVTKPNCLIAIFFDLTNEVKSLCHFQIQQNDIQPSISLINPTELLVYNMSAIMLHCNQIQSSIQGCHFCIMSRSCCAMTALDFYIPNKIHGCKNHSKEITKVFPFNLGLIQHFLHHNDLAKFSGNMHSKWPNQLIIPQVQNPASPFDNKMSFESTYRTQINDLLAWMNQSNSKQTIPSDLPSDYSWYTVITSAVSIVMSSIALILSIIICIKIGCPIWFFHTPGTEAYTGEVENFDCSMDAIAGYSSLAEIGILLLVMIACIILYLKYKHSHFRKQSTMSLELSTGKYCMLIPIMKLPLCPRFWHLSANSQTEIINLSHHWHGILKLNWNGLQIHNMLTDENYNPISEIQLGIFQTKLARYIIHSTTYFKSVVIHHNSSAYYIPICDSDCNNWPNCLLEAGHPQTDV